MTNIISFIVGPWAIILLLKIGIEQCKKLALFLKIIYSSDKKKHNKKIMVISLIKYLLFLVALVLCTHKIFAVYLIPLWLIILYLSWYYTRLWKYHGYSVLLLIFVSCATVITVVFTSQFIRQFIAFLIKNWGQFILIGVALLIIGYNIFSKFDDEEEKIKKSEMHNSNKSIN